MNALRRSVLLPLLVIVPAAFSPAAFGAEPEKPAVKQTADAPHKFMRFVDDGAAGGKLETADVTYKNADGTTVCLVAAIHIGEKSYFEGLNQSFKKYDSVLYELVKPKDAKPPAPGDAPKTGSGVSDFQRMLKDTLNLEFQLDAIDYSQKNFVHADMDAETFQKLSEERGETIPMLLMKNIMKAMSDPGVAQKAVPAGNVDDQIKDVVRMITRPDAERQLKLLVARHMMDIEMDAAGLALDGSVILTERNKAALKVLDDTLKDKKQKSIAVYYGAAHMTELEKSLAERGFKPAATEWRTAWDLKIRADQPSAIEKILIDGIDALINGDDGQDEADDKGNLWTSAE